MTHQRQKIREAVKALLENIGPWDDRVWTNRPNPLSQRPNTQSSRSKLPAVLIYTRDESSEIVNEAPREYLRTVELVVEVAEAMNDAIDDTLDGYAQTIERAILVDDTLGRDVDDCLIADQIRLVSSSLAITDTGDTMIGASILRFDVDYYEFLPGEETADALGDFEGANIEYNLGGEQLAEDAAHDEIDVPVV